MAESQTAPTFERRWPVILAVVITYALLTILPDRLRLGPAWLPLLLGAAVSIPMVVVGFTREKAAWLRLERV